MNIKFKYKDLEFSLYEVDMEQFKTLKSLVDFGKRSELRKNVYDLDLSVIQEEYVKQCLNIILLLNQSLNNIQLLKIWKEMDVNVYRSFVILLDYLNPSEQMDKLWFKFRMIKKGKVLYLKNTYLGIMFGEYYINFEHISEEHTKVRILTEALDKNVEILFNTNFDIDMFYTIIKNMITLIDYNKNYKVELDHNRDVVVFKPKFNVLILTEILIELEDLLEKQNVNLLPELSIVKDLMMFTGMKISYPNQYSHILSVYMDNTYMKKLINHEWSNNLERSARILGQEKNFYVTRINSGYRVYHPNRNIVITDYDPKRNVKDEIHIGPNFIRYNNLYEPTGSIYDTIKLLKNIKIEEIYSFINITNV